MSASPSSPANRPRKRPRRASVTHASVTHASPPRDGYLSTFFDATTPILVLVAPLRATQARILTRNLSLAGATVLATDAVDPPTLHLTLTRLHVLTDDAARADARLAPRLRAAATGRIVFVSTQWASTVLRARAFRPITSFVLQPLPGDDTPALSLSSTPSSPPVAVQGKNVPCDYAAGNNPRRTSSPPLQSPSPSFSPSLPPPGWVTPLDVPDAARRHMLSLIPRLSCDRATLPGALYAGPNEPLACVMDAMARRRHLECGSAQNVAAADARARAYERAASLLRCVPLRVRPGDEAAALDGFGARVCAVAGEFLREGRVRELDGLQLAHGAGARGGEGAARARDRDGDGGGGGNDNENKGDVEVCRKLRVLEQLTTAYGVGVRTGWSLVSDGVTDVNELRLLRDGGAVIAAGREWDRVTWAEAMSFRAAVVATAASSCVRARVKRDGRHVIDGNDEAERDVDEEEEECGGGPLALRAELCGGFRRGAADGHDVDIVYCARDGLGVSTRRADSDAENNAKEWRSGRAAERVLAKLRRAGLVERVLSARRSSFVPGARGGHDVVLAVGRIGNKAVRVDLVGVRDADEMACATLAWSGSTGFQRDLRLAAGQRGYSFCERGLFQAGGAGGRVGGPLRSEMDVFAALGLVYRAPFERAG